MILPRYIFTVMRIVGYNEALPLQYNFLPPAVTRTGLILIFDGHRNTTSFTYVTFCTFGIVCGWMKKIIFVLLDILNTTSWASRPKSFAFSCSHIFALGPLMKFWYLSKLPGTFLMNELGTCCIWLVCVAFVSAKFYGVREVVLFMSWSLSLSGSIIFDISIDNFCYRCRNYV